MALEYREQVKEYLRKNYHLPSNEDLDDILDEHLDVLLRGERDKSKAYYIGDEIATLQDFEARDEELDDEESETGESE